MYYDFAEVCPGQEMLEGIRHFAEAEHTVDLRAQLVLLQRAEQVAEHCAGPNAHGVQSRQAADELDCVERQGRAAQEADERDAPAKPHGAQRLHHGVGAADLQHQVHAGPPGQFAHTVRPLRRGAIVDGLIGAKLTGPGQFFVAARDDQSAQAGRMGQLQAEERDPARALEQNGRAWSQIAVTEEGVPRCDSSDGQCGALLEGKVVGQG